MGQAKHGRKTHIELDNLAGVLTDITRKGTSINLQRDVELPETTAFEATNKEFTVGFKDNKVTMDGNADAAIATQLNAILGESEPTGGVADEGFDLVWGPEGNASGKRKYSLKVICMKFSESNGVNAANKFTAEFQAVTDLTVGAYA